MTREEAIAILQTMEYELSNQVGSKYCQKKYEAVKMSIKALEQEPSHDAISRQAVMDCFKKWQPYMATRLWDFEQELSKLPSVKPQEPKIEKVIKMREATPEERESVEKYVKSISKPTGVDFWDLEQEPCNDAISRQDAIRICEERGHDNSAYCIRQLPSVKPQEKMGHWIYALFGFECSNCHKSIEGEWNDNIDDITGTLFCPNCGAKMVQESETWNGIHAQITAPKGTFERIFNEADDDNDI